MEIYTKIKQNGKKIFNEFGAFTGLKMNTKSQYWKEDCGGRREWRIGLKVRQRLQWYDTIIRDYIEIVLEKSSISSIWVGKNNKLFPRVVPIMQTNHSIAFWVVLLNIIFIYIIPVEIEYLIYN